MVNANVLRHLGDCAEAAPVADYLARALASGAPEESDKWHRNRHAFYYAVSRALAAGVSALEPLREPLTAAVELALTQPQELEPAEVALAGCALLNLGAAGAGHEAAVASLGERQRRDGSWPAIALWGGGGPDYGWGSEALTTALCVEALTRFSEGAVMPSTRS